MNSRMINCKACNNEISKNAKACPACGEKNKKPFYKRWYVWVIGLLILGSMGDTSTTTSTGQTTALSTDTTSNGDRGEVLKEEYSKAPEFELIEEITVEQDLFATYFNGVVRNNKSRDLSYMSITINLYDSNGHLVGTALDNINNVKSGGTWKFKAMSLGVDNADVASYEIAEIIGF